jgi:hypothetical protein
LKTLAYACSGRAVRTCSGALAGAI